MATRESNLDLGNDGKREAGGIKACLIHDGGALAPVAAEPAPTLTNKVDAQVAARA